jgi:hypothetical protein
LRTLKNVKVLTAYWHYISFIHKLTFLVSSLVILMRVKVFIDIYSIGKCGEDFEIFVILMYNYSPGIVILMSN